MLVDKIKKSLFIEADEALFSSLIPKFNLRKYGKGDIILKEGFNVENLYLINKGFVDAIIIEENKKIKIAVLTENDVFGEMALISNLKASATVVATDDVEIYEIKSNDFLEAINTDKDLKQSFYESILQTLTKRLRLTSANYAMNDYLLKIIKDKNYQLSQLNTKLTEVSKQKDYYLGIAAHDIRNPISVVLVYLSLLCDGNYGHLNDEGMHIISRISKEMYALTNLLNDLLDVSQIESGNIILNKSEVNFLKLVQDSVDFHNITASKKEIKINVESQINEAILVNMDKTKITSVLNNLFSNAIKYSNRNSEVFSTVKADQDYAYLIIKDSGVGIKDVDRDNIFKPFARTNTKPTEGEKSTRLGLSITKKILLAHDGEIWFESKEGEGSSFSIKLPLGEKKNG
ncbi:MAG: ATP-binding protein [Pseudomonadota bacterium]